MAASANDLFMEVGSPGTATTLSAPGYTAGGVAVTIGSTSNWPTATGVIFAIDEAEVINGVEVQVAGTYNEFEGVVSSGTSVTSVDWVRGVGDRNYSAGALTRVYVPVSAERENRLAQGIGTSLDQDGTLKAGAVDVAAVLASDVVTTAKILDSNVTTAKIADSNVTHAKVAAGFPVQVVSTNFAASSTTTSLIPLDDTIPQITEGAEFMTQVITPKSATNTLIIEVTAYGALATAIDFFTVALFQDTTANALAALPAEVNTAHSPRPTTLTHTMVAGTTSATTFRVRLGSNGANTLTFNGRAGSRNYGAITKSHIKITEYKS